MESKGRRRVDDALAERVVRLLKGHPSIRDVRLVGSRAEGCATPVSDWDFAVEPRDFASASSALPELIRPLSPLGTFWDPLSPIHCFSAILPGARKVDFIFKEPHRKRPRYLAGPTTLARMDVHFWDWTIWLAAKEAAGRTEFVASELRKMHDYLTGPLGVPEVPSTLVGAVRTYLRARDRAEGRFGQPIDRRLSEEALRFLTRAGYAVPKARALAGTRSEDRSRRSERRHRTFRKTLPRAVRERSGEALRRPRAGRTTGAVTVAARRAFRRV
jgi:predicted nucleotidyltransferase